MNPLSQLPASNSGPFKLNLVDAWKMLRMAIIVTAGQFVPILATWITQQHFTAFGLDFDPLVGAASALALELARRYVMNNGPQAQ